MAHRPSDSFLSMLVLKREAVAVTPGKFKLFKFAKSLIFQKYISLMNLYADELI